jgi:hypothetical protein
MSGYTLSPLAKADVFHIWCFIAADSEAAADRVEQAVYEACALITEGCGGFAWNKEYEKHPDQAIVELAWSPRLAVPRPARNLTIMEVHFAPALQAKIDQLVADSGCPVEALLEDASPRNARSPL